MLRRPRRRPPPAAPKAAAAEPTKAPEATKAPEPTKAPAPDGGSRRHQGARADQGPGSRCGRAQGPIPYPDPPKIEVGAEPVKRQKISEIVTYKALPEYKEPAWVTDLVKAGKLPAIKDRLPKEPRVILKSGMADGVGVYGDVGRFFSACPTAGWNYTAGTTAGWFGIDSYSYSYDRWCAPARSSAPTRYRAVPAARQELGVVGRRQAIDHEADRRRQVV